MGWFDLLAYLFLLLKLVEDIVFLERFVLVMVLGLIEFVLLAGVIVKFFSVQLIFMLLHINFVGFLIEVATSVVLLRGSGLPGCALTGAAGGQLLVELLLL